MSEHDVAKLMEGCDILSPDHMKRALTVAGIAVVAFILGASAMHLLKKQRSGVWISVVSDGAGFGMSGEALNGDIPWPETSNSLFSVST